MKFILSIIVLVLTSSNYLFGQCGVGYAYPGGGTQSGTCSETAGNRNINGAFTVDGDLTINGDFTIGGTDLVVNGTLTVTGDLISGGGSSVVIANGGTINADNLTSALFATFTVESGGTLNVTNDAGTGLFAAFTVEDGGTVDIGGDFTTGGIGITTIDGDMNVDGDFTNVGGGVVDGDGDLTVGGTYTNGGDDSGFTGTYNGGDPLPVEMVYFRGEATNDEVRLNWLTASEINNEGFEIERSSDGVHFTQIAFVAGFGTTNEPNEYTYIDRSVAERSYYRLKQVDFDGQFEYSSIIAINGGSMAGKLEAYPNPTNGPVHLLTAISNYQLYDQMGRVVMSASSTTSIMAEQEISQFLENANPGSYVLVSEIDGKPQRLRLVRH
ncbi:MAG: hypothetical protein RLN88_00290 [Ekhidna sp.]|uniref:hypothetical protein n=1 Tax=Ekhidna sp. TaxID=2608089 RepID=UPI0032EC9227